MTTLREIAAEADVHISTVSRVLNGHQSDMVSPDTRDRILEVAGRLRYRPSAAARALASGRSSVMAVGYSRPDDPHFLHVLAIAQRLAEARGYHLQIALSRDQLRDWLSERRADIVLDIGVVDDADEITRSVSADHQRVLSCGPSYRALPTETMCAYWKNSAGIRSALRHLVDLGHRRIAFLAGTQDSGKFEAFNTASEEMDLQPVIVRSDAEDDLLAAGAQMARRLLREERAVTAILARNDEFACGALHALHEAGVTVPDELSIVGFNDIRTAPYLFPSLTTVRTPLCDCAERLLPMALDSTAAGMDGEWKPEATEMTTTLVVRSSTAQVKA